MGIEETVARLREDVTEAQRRRASADALGQRAEARAAAVREDLEGGFGVSTAGQARHLLAELEQRLEKEAAEVRRLLDLAGRAA
jgi:hypothetical protein